VGDVQAGYIGAEAALAGAKSGASQNAALQADLAYKPAIESAVTEASLTTQAGLKPGLDAAVTTAVEQAKQGVIEGVQAKDNMKSFGSYKVSMDALMDALAKAPTGPLVGRGPQVLPSQQLVAGISQVVGIAIKGIVRMKGEGTWTKEDQQYINDTLPSAKDHISVAIAKRNLIDAYLMQKYGMDTSSAGPATTAAQKGASPAGAPISLDAALEMYR
jgi:hypothetical protein